MHTKVTVVGGGLTGKAAAVAAARAGIETAHVAPSAQPDRRTSALMMPSVAFMRRAGLIEEPEALGAPLTAIRIIDATNRFLRAPEVSFAADEYGLDAFGWNFSNVRLGARFDEVAKTVDLTAFDATLVDAKRVETVWHLTLSDGSTMTTDLLVGADGKASLVRTLAGIGHREHRFDQAALVCDLEIEYPLEGCSTEFHYPEGPFTLVPAGGNKANLVWIDRPEVLQEARSEPEALQRALDERSQRLFGTITITTPTFVFPLSTISVETAGANGAVLVGEAAHAFPPIGAQGLNLGLRDIEALDAALKNANPGSWNWADPVVGRYARERRGDFNRTGAFVDSLFRSLVSDLLPPQALRSGGLWAMRTLPWLKRRAIGFGLGQ